MCTLLTRDVRSPDVIIPAVSTQLWQSLSDSLILQHPWLVPRHPLFLSLFISWDISLPSFLPAREVMRIVWLRTAEDIGLQVLSFIFLSEDTETPVTEGWDEHTPVRWEGLKP